MYYNYPFCLLVSTYKYSIYIWHQVPNMIHVSKNMNLYNQLTVPAIIFIISCINQSINKEALLPLSHQTIIIKQQSQSNQYFTKKCTEVDWLKMMMKTLRNSLSRKFHRKKRIRINLFI